MNFSIKASRMHDDMLSRLNGTEKCQSLQCVVIALTLFICTSFSIKSVAAPLIYIPADSSDQELSSALQLLVNDFNGDVGIYVEHLTFHNQVAINADKLFPTASMVKVPILLTLFSKIETGELNYTDLLTYKDSLLYEGDDILGSFKDGEEIALSKLVMLMITMSDNTASLWCQQLAGTGTEINKWLDDHEFDSTRMNSRTPGRKENWQQYGWGQTTPREMAGLLKLIRSGRAVSASASEEMYRVLGNIYWNSEALSQIPPNVNTASKQGFVSQSRSEVVMVNAPSGDYVFCIITNNQQDTSSDYDNEGLKLIRDVSRIIWQHFEPDSEWQPSPEQRKWVK